MSRIWIGDWLRAWRALGPDAGDAERAALTAMLDLAPPPRPIALVEAAVAPVDEAADVAAEIVEPARAAPSAHAARPAEGPGPGTATSGELTLSGPVRDQKKPQAWRAVAALPPASRRIPHATHEPLFDRTLARAVLAAIAATQHAEGAVLTKEAVDIVARRRRVRRLPRRLVSTVRSGLAVVLVRSGLEPFSDDLMELFLQLRRVVGVGAIGEWTLDAGGLRSRERVARPWPPAVGTPCVFVTIDPSDPRLADEARTLAARSSPAIALVPGRATRPSELPYAVALVPWDHRTRVREVLRARQAAGQR